MKPRIEIVQPSLEISELQKELIVELSKIIPDSTVEAIGSMAVPISGRSEIDIMIVSKNVDRDRKLLTASGFREGFVIHDVSYLSVRRGGIRVDLQILPVGHKMIETNRRTLNTLRENPEIRGRYEEFKKSLVGVPQDEYKIKKVEWLEENLSGK